MTIKNIVARELSPGLELDTPSKRGNPFRIKEVASYGVTIGAGRTQSKSIQLEWRQFEHAVNLVKRRHSVLIGSSVGDLEPASLRHEFQSENWCLNHANYISSILEKVGIFEFSGDRIIHVLLRSPSRLKPCRN